MVILKVDLTKSISIHPLHKNTEKFMNKEQKFWQKNKSEV